jgi:hypothetical protein
MVLIRPQIVFIHLPKTGGMSLHAAIAGALSPSATLRIGDERELAAFLAMGREEVARRSFVSGHVGFDEAAARARGGARFITLLRDPVARLLSAFNYMATWPGHPLYAEMRGRTFGEFVLSSGEALSGEACRQLTGVPTAAEAIRVLDSCYAAAATTGRLEDLAALASAWLGLPLPPIPRENVTPGQGRVTFDSRSLSLLLEVTREDRTLYEHLERRHGGLMVAPGMGAG